MQNANIYEIIFAVEAAERIMNECSNDEKNAVNIVILPPDNVGLLTNDEEVQHDNLMINNELLCDVCGTVQVQTNFLNGKDNDDEVEYDDNANEKQTE